MLDTLREDVYPGELAADLLESIRVRGAVAASRAPLPGPEALRALLDAAFRASLQPEEGRYPSFALAFIPDDRPLGPDYAVCRFANPGRLDPGELAKMAPAVDADTTFVAVSATPRAPQVWGLVLSRKPREGLAVKGVDPETIADPFLVIRVRRPGVLYVYCAHQLELLYARGVAIPPFKVGSLMHTLHRGVGLLDPDAPEGSALAQVVSRVGLLGHGGTVLVTDPHEPVAPELLDLAYTFTPPSRVLADLVRAPTTPPPAAQSAEEVIELVAGLARMDGAVHLTSDLVVRGFGAKIRKLDRPPFPTFVSEDPVTGTEREVRFSDLSGMRHRSAALFCAHQQGSALALVISQDGDVTLFGRQDDGRVRRIGPFVLGSGVFVS